MITFRFIIVIYFIIMVLFNLGRGNNTNAALDTFFALIWFLNYWVCIEIRLKRK